MKILAALNNEITEKVNTCTVVSLNHTLYIDSW